MQPSGAEHRVGWGEIKPEIALIPEMKSIQEILRESGSLLHCSASSYSDRLSRYLYPIVEESPDELMVATDDSDTDSWFQAAEQAIEREMMLAEIGDDFQADNNSVKPTNQTTDPDQCRQPADTAADHDVRRRPSSSDDDSDSSSLTSSFTSTYSDSDTSLEESLASESATAETRIEEISATGQENATETDEMHRWSLRIQPQQLDSIAEAEGSSSSCTSVASSAESAEAVQGSSNELALLRPLKPGNGVVEDPMTLCAPIELPSAIATVRVVASTRAQIRDAYGHLTGDEACATTEATGATVGVAVARAAARAASIATSTVMRGGGGDVGDDAAVKRYRILISTQCDVEHSDAMPIRNADMEFRGLPLTTAENKIWSKQADSETDKVLRFQNQKPKHQAVTEEVTVHFSKPQQAPTLKVESTYISSSGGESSSTEDDDSESEKTGVSPRMVVYQSVLQRGQPGQPDQSQQARLRSSADQDQDRIRRAREACLSGRDSFREQLLTRSLTSSKEAQNSVRERPSKEGNDRVDRNLDSTLATSRCSLRELLDDGLARQSFQGQQQEQQRRIYRSTDLDRLDGDFDNAPTSRDTTDVSILLTEPGKFQSISLFNLARSALVCTDERIDNGLSHLSLLETDVDAGKATHICVEADMKAAVGEGKPNEMHSPRSQNKRSRSLLNLTGDLDSKARQSATETGTGNAISRSNSKRRGKQASSDSSEKQKSFIERLEERATTEPERDICQSLSRLRIPTWLDNIPLTGNDAALVARTRRGICGNEEAQIASKTNSALTNTEASVTNEVSVSELEPRTEIEFAEGHLKPQMLPSSASLPCLLAVRPGQKAWSQHVELPQESKRPIRDRPSSEITQQILWTRDRPSSWRHSDSLGSKQKRLSDLCSQLERPPLEKVTLKPTDFVTRAQTSLARQAEPCLGGPGAEEENAQKHTNHLSAPPPLPSKSRTTLKRVSSVHSEAIAIATAAISAERNRTSTLESGSQRPLDEASQLPTTMPPLPPRSKQARPSSVHAEAMAIAAAAITAWPAAKSISNAPIGSSQARQSPPVPVRSKPRSSPALSSVHTEAIDIAAASIAAARLSLQPSNWADRQTLSTPPPLPPRHKYGPNSDRDSANQLAFSNELRKLSVIELSSETSTRSMSEIGDSVDTTSLNHDRRSTSSTHASGAADTSSDESTTFVMATEVQRRIISRNVEWSPAASSNVLAHQSEPDVMNADADNELLDLIDSQLRQFEASMSELKRDGFSRDGSYAEMIAAIEESGRIYKKSTSPEVTSPRDSVMQADAACQGVIADCATHRPETRRLLARLARTSRRCLGPGFVILKFESARLARRFAPLRPPVFTPIREIRNRTMRAPLKAELISHCETCDSDNELAILIAVAQVCRWAVCRVSDALSLERHHRDRSASLRSRYPDLYALLDTPGDRRWGSDGSLMRHLELATSAAAEGDEGPRFLFSGRWRTSPSANRCD